MFLGDDYRLLVVLLFGVNARGGLKRKWKRLRRFF